MPVSEEVRTIVDVRGSESQVEIHRVWLMLVLTFAAGAVDAVSNLGLHSVFTANMTGNVVFLAFAAASENHLQVSAAAAALGGFMVGALLAGRICRHASRAQPWPPAVTVSLVFACMSLVVAEVCAASARHSISSYIFVSLLSFAMGTQGAEDRRLAVADLPTTVVTSTITGLAADSWFGSRVSGRQFRRAGSPLCLLLGALSGAVLLRSSLAAAVVPALIAVTTVTVIAILRAPGRRHR